jgi:LmbE family N-acetylglucosaminyl deacetylase
MPHCLLAVFSHPDDETVVGPLLAKYAAEGHQVHLLSLTAGEKGYHAHAGIPAGEPLAAARTRELECAAGILGLASCTVLRFPDLGFFSSAHDPIWDSAVAAVRESIDRVAPDVVVTWGPEGGTGHPDHRATNSVVVQAFQQRKMLKHKPGKLYYAVFAEAASPDGWAAHTRVSREFITTDVDCSAYVPVAEKAIACHRSQWTPESIGKITSLYDASRGRIYLRLAYSTGAQADSIEADVFAGI